MKRYFVKSKIEGKVQINETSKESFELLKTMGGVFPLKVLKEDTDVLLDADGNVIQSKDSANYETIQVPFILKEIEVKEKEVE